MEKHHNPSIFYNFSALYLLFNACFLVHGQLLPIVKDCSNSTELEVFIVHVRKPNATKLLSAEDQEKYYNSFFTTPPDPSQPRILYSYNHVINGFAARLSANELKEIQSRDGFIHAHRDREFPLQTTHSANFLGLHQSHCFWKDSSFGQGIIIGVVDTGILPYHPSFSDDGVPAPPTKWKGTCDFDVPICNNKLIGARGFSKGCRESPVDKDGHGTHTASVAAGNFVEKAAVLGQAQGTAAGMAPKAHLAIYSVCDKNSCFGSDILAGIDQAIADGVDVLSISMGRSDPFYDNSIAIGTLSAAAKGIFVSAAAGNGGPGESSVLNDAPWLLTVGASTIDRTIRSTVKLGSGVEINGESAYQPYNFPPTQLPLVYPGATGIARAETCSYGSLNDINVRGKIVLCSTGGVNTDVEKGAVVKRAGGVGMILMNQKPQGFTPEASAHVIPAAHVSNADAAKIKTYINSYPTPTAAIIFKGTWYGTPPSPAVASFSSRGPSLNNNGILKPDIIGPGVNIVGAWPSNVGFLSLRNLSSTTFNVISGTSVSAPHLAGIAALLKVSHPDWSPAAIKSAIMTSPDVLNGDGKPITDETLNKATYFATGAGHVNPSKANDPGLVYELTIDDYIAYLCGLGFADSQVSAIARYEIECLKLRSITAEELNYPTFLVAIGPNSQKTIRRTVKNVGGADEVYSVQVDAPEGVEVTVYPNQLEFYEINQTAVYNVYFTTRNTGERVGTVTEGQLRWISGSHVVRSPISASFI